MKKVRYLVIVYLLLMCLPANSNILMRSTFEEYKGSSLQEMGWDSLYSGNGKLLIGEEDPQDRYQTQLHGKFSLQIYDPNDTSYAYAKHKFPSFGIIPNHPEYMVEFYFWFPDGGVEIENVYLYKPTKNTNPADIEIVLDSTDIDTTGSDNFAYYLDDKFYITVSDSDTSISYTYTDSVLVLKAQDPLYDAHALRWHKFQVHKLFNSDTIILYIDGELIDTFTAFTGTNHPDTFLIGTTDTLQNGEGFWDDFIITTVPTGNHPRLFFTQSDTGSLRDRADDTTGTILGWSFKDMADTIITLADSCMGRGYFTYPFCYEYTMNLPFPQPEPSSKSKYTAWLSINREIEAWLQVLSFSYIIENDTNYSDSTKAILMSLSNDWAQWTNMQWGTQTLGAHPYTSYDAAHLVASVAIAYDMIFDKLNGYEKMTIQNSLLSLGINQDYLVALWLLEWDNNPIYHPNGYAVIFSAMGLASLVIDDSNVRNLCDSIANVRIKHILDERKVCDSLGGWIEGITYSEYGTDYIVAYAEAEKRIQNDTILKDEPYPENYPTFRTYCTVYGADRDSNVEVNFEDYNDMAWYANEGVMYLNAENADSLGQWYLAHSRIKWPEWRNSGGYVCIDLIQRYFQFGPFLWFDAGLDTLHPDSIPLPLGRLMDDIGWGVLRNGWDSNSKVLGFKSDTCGCHCHPAQNRFIYGSKGKWFIEEMGYPPKEKKGPPWHNVILVNGTQTDSTENGEIKGFYTCDDYGYIMGDASACDFNLSKWLREIIMVNEPGFIVVKDGIESDTTVMIDWRMHTHIGTGEEISDKDSVITIKKAGKYLCGEILEPKEGEWDIFSWGSPYQDWKRMSIDSVGSITKATYLVSFFIGDTFPEITKIKGTSVIGARVKYAQDTTDAVVMFSKGCSDVKGLSYDVDVDSSDSIVFNVLADLYVPQEQATVTVIDENLDTGTRQDTSLTPTSVGTASLEISGTGTHRITVFIPGKIESSSYDATSPNSTRRFLYEDSLERYHLLYEDNYQIMHGERFSNIDGWVEGYQIGEGEYPALASYTDTAGNSILNAVWAKEKVIFYSRFTYETGWSKPCSLVSYSGTYTPHYFPPSLAIDDSGKAHLAWGIVLQGTSEPCTVFSILRYSTFDAGLDTPSLSDTATLDSVVKPSSSSWSMGYASLDLYNDTISVVVWSRPIGAGKDTIYCKQETASGWPSSPEIVSSSSAKATKPFCDITGNSVYVVWEEEGVIKFRKRHITGEWMSIETVSNTLLTSRNSQIVNGDICLYSEVPQLQPNHRSHVVYRKRSEQGTWGSSNILESTGYESEYPQCLILEQDLYVVWTEGNSSPYEIKFKKKSEP